MSAADNMIEEEDEIIRELDVYVAENLDLFLLQFPLKPCYIEPPTIKSAMFKPEHMKLEIDCGPNVPHMVASTLPKTANLAIGIVRDNALHITAVQDVLQLRPSFENLKTEDEFIVPDDDENEEEKTKAKSQALQQVQIKRKETEKSLNYRRRSYAYAKSKEDSEPWNTLKVHDLTSNESLTTFEELYYKITEENNNNNNNNTSSYHHSHI